MFLELIEVMAYKEYSDIRLEDLCPSHTIVEKRMASEKSLSDSSVIIILNNIALLHVYQRQQGSEQRDCCDSGLWVS